MRRRSGGVCIAVGAGIGVAMDDLAIGHTIGDGGVQHERLDFSDGAK